VTAITRANSTTKLPAGVKSAVVDYDDEQSLVTALEGQQFLIITISLTASPDTQSKLIRAAAKAGVAYVMPNWHGVDPQNEDMLRECPVPPERRTGPAEIKALGVSSSVVLSCGFWYEYSLAAGPDTFGIDIKNRGITWIDSGSTRINVTSWPQCGRAVAALLGLKELPEDEDDKSPSLSQFRDSVVYISSFRISQRDMFESVKRVTGTGDADWKMTHESSKERWKQGIEALKRGDIMTGFLKQLYSRVLFPNGGGDYEAKRELRNELLGLPKEDLDALTGVAVRAAGTGKFEY
jgi:hypothetical protein